MAYEFKIIKESSKNAGVRLVDFPITVVLEKKEGHPGYPDEYCTHVRVYPSVGEPYLIWGHYFADAETKGSGLKAATEDYKERCKKERVVP